ncbi:hypothetical protein BLA29_003228 [Euroglyphus maynei]|uniref:Uncharacterized protein n=1 Tax=Euroglyphus maynei TaxID=6958 RepID=A0A1Y3ANE3_EURMA|nr:hypothetical protein BLA29_003228 [Euroglyphus maynei]
MDNCHKVREYYDFPILFDYLKEIKLNKTSSFSRRTNFKPTKCTEKQDKNNHEGTKNYRYSK